MYKLIWFLGLLLSVSACGGLQPFNLQGGSRGCVDAGECFIIKAWDGQELVYTSKPGYGYCTPQSEFTTHVGYARWLCKWWVNGVYEEKTFPAHYYVGQCRMTKP